MLARRFSVNEEARNKKAASFDRVLFLSNGGRKDVLKQSTAIRIQTNHLAVSSLGKFSSS